MTRYCCKCGKQFETDNKQRYVCIECYRIRDNAYHRAYREKRRKLGLCGYCGRPLTTKNRTCEVCRARAKERRINEEVKLFDTVSGNATG